MKSTLLAYSLMLSVLALEAAGQTQIDLRNQGKNVDFSSASSTKPFRSGTQLPAVCSVGEAYFKTDAQAGQNLYACTSANVWTLESGANGVPGMGGQTGKVLSNNGSASEWRALGGDISGSPDAAVVGGLQGRSVSSTGPGDGQVLRWNAGAAQWQPATETAPGGPNYSQAFTSQTTVTITGASHGLGTANLLVECYNSANPAVRLTPSSITVNSTTYDVTVTFSSSQSGRCVVNGSGAGSAVTANNSNTFVTGTTQTFQGALVAASADRTAPAKAGASLPATCVQGDQYFKTDATAGQNLYFCTAANTWTQMSGAQAVASVFGRTGPVTAASGDYNFSQISGAATNGQIASGIDAAKIGAGTVSNTAFGYLANVSSDIQAQLAGKAATSHSHTAAGDVEGDLDNLTTTGIQGRPIAATAPTDGQALVWNTTVNAWQPGAAAGGGGGAMMTSQLNDFAAVRTSSTALSIGASCAPATPCNVRFGNTVYSLTQSCSATITAGTGTAFVYLTSNGTLTIGHNVTLAASGGCLAQSDVTSFPSDAIPLYSWTATSGTWDSDGAHDYRAFLSTREVVAGPGLFATDSGTGTTLAVDNATVPTYLTAAANIDFPSIANGACSADQSFTLSGAAVNDSVAPGWPGTLGAGLLGLMRVSAANTIAVRLCNFSGAVNDPPNATFRATIIRSF